MSTRIFLVMASRDPGYGGYVVAAYSDEAKAQELCQTLDTRHKHADFWVEDTQVDSNEPLETLAEEFQP
jgi:hypothetical protein